MPGYLGNLKFPRFPKFLLESDGGGFLNILEISQVPGCLRNFPGNFSCLGIWKTYQIPIFFTGIILWGHRKSSKIVKT